MCDNQVEKQKEALSETMQNIAMNAFEGKLKRSDILACLKSKTGHIPSNSLVNQPKSVKRAVNALKKLQLNHINIEVEFFKELHELEMKYEKKFAPLYEKRFAIVTGAEIPTDEECNLPSDYEKEIELSNEIAKVNLEDENKVDEIENADVKGIPEFWLTALKNVPTIADLIEEYDEPILKYLTDIRAVSSSDPMSFFLEFDFEPNEYFTNNILTKSYQLKCAPDPSDIFSFDGPEIVKSKGCIIDWKKGKNVTIKTIKKKQKHKARGAVRTVTKTVQNESFFNFFSPPLASEEEEMDEETQNAMHTDFEIGNVIKDRVIPQAVLFYTGENLDDDFDDEEEEDEEDYEDDDDDEEDEEENDNQCLNQKKSSGQTPSQQENQPPECKQQ